MPVLERPKHPQQTTEELIKRAETRFAKAQSEVEKAISRGNVSPQAIERLSDAYAEYLKVRTSVLKK